MNPADLSHVTADLTSNAVLNWVSDSSLVWTVPKPPFSFYYPFQVIDIQAGPPGPGRGGILYILDESSTLISLSDSGLTTMLCLVLTSMPKQYTKHSVKSPSASIPSRRTNKLICLRCSGLQPKSDYSRNVSSFWCLIPPLPIHIYLSETCNPPPPFFFFSPQYLLAFNSALDVKSILKIQAFRSKGKYSPDEKEKKKKLSGSFTFFCCCAPLLLLKCCWGRGQMGRVFLIIQHGWYFKQEAACVPCARHESAQLVRGHEELGFPLGFRTGEF